MMTSSVVKKSPKARLELMKILIRLFLQEELVGKFFNIKERSQLAKLSECAEFLKEHYGSGCFVGRTSLNVR